MSGIWNTISLIKTFLLLKQSKWFYWLYLTSHLLLKMIVTWLVVIPLFCRGLLDLQFSQTSFTKTYANVDPLLEPYSLLPQAFDSACSSIPPLLLLPNLFSSTIRKTKVCMCMHFFQNCYDVITNWQAGDVVFSATAVSYLSTGYFSIIVSIYYLNWIYWGDKTELSFSRTRALEMARWDVFLWWTSCRGFCLPGIFSLFW